MTWENVKRRPTAKQSVSNSRKETANANYSAYTNFGRGFFFVGFLIGGIVGTVIGVYTAGYWYTGILS